MKGGGTHETKAPTRDHPDRDRRDRPRRWLGQHPRSLRIAGRLSRAWPIYADQAVARAAAGWPTATPREQIRSLWTYARLRALRNEREIPEVLSVVGEDHGRAALTTTDDAGGYLPLIVTFPHIGAFEAAAQILPDLLADLEQADRADRILIVSDDVETPTAPARILADRYGWATVSIYDPDVGTSAFLTLRDGGILLVSSDVLPPSQRDTAATVRFLDQTVLLPSGIARLAFGTGALIVPVAAYLDGRAARVLILPAIGLDSRLSIDALAQDLADQIGSLICEDPDQWFPPWPIERAPDLG